MRISELLQSIASWLESPNNEALLLSEYNEECSKIVAENCVLAAALLKNAAEEVELIEPIESHITPESLEELSNIATAFDASGDEGLKRQASVIDELLLTIAAPPDALNQIKRLQDSRIEEAKKKYNVAKDEHYITNRIAESEKAIDKSNFTKKFKILEAPLSSRYCPDHAGTQIARVGENAWQCELDKKVYDFETGFTLNNGEHVPGSSVSEQTSGLDSPSHAVFDTRIDKLNR